jgi:hypothetical protein
MAVYVVSAKEVEPPKEVESIDWTLLTNVPVNSIEHDKLPETMTLWHSS